ELISALLGAEVYENSRSEFSGCVVTPPKLNPRHVAQSFVHSLSVRAYSTDDCVELTRLRQQHSTRELAHAEIRADKPVQLLFADLLLMRRAQSAQIVEARRTLEQHRIRSHNRPAFARRHRLVELQTVDAN